MPKIIKNPVGEVFDTSHGKVEIVDFFNCQKVIVKFLGYNDLIETTFSNIKKGEIKNRMLPTIAGVGIIGYDIKNPTKHPLYGRWAAMILRCYDVNNSNYSAYGGAGVYVDKDWLYFPNYVRDVSKMEHYKELINDSRNWDIDKDKSGDKIYSKNTCLIIKKSENCSLSSTSRQKSIYQLTLDGQIVRKWESTKAASASLGISSGNICSCLKGRLKTCGGFIWRYAEK